jgi:hypothetical protein
LKRKRGRTFVRVGGGGEVEGPDVAVAEEREVGHLEGVEDGARFVELPFETLKEENEKEPSDLSGKEGRKGEERKERRGGKGKKKGK